MDAVTDAVGAGKFDGFPHERCRRVFARVDSHFQARRFCLPHGWHELAQWEISFAVGEVDAEAVRRERCPLYVQEIVSFDEGSWGFGEYMLALHELYEPAQRLGPDLWATRLRATPAGLVVTGAPFEHFRDFNRVNIADFLETAQALLGFLSEPAGRR